MEFHHWASAETSSSRVFAEECGSKIRNTENRSTRNCFGIRFLRISLLTKLIGEEIDGYRIIDCFVDDNSLYFVLFKDGMFYRTKILMEHVFFSVFEDNDFGLKVGQLFSKKLEQERFGDDNVSEDSE